MNLNTHTEFCFSKDFNYIISGVKDECNHNWNGPSYFVTQSGKIITYKTHLQWISYTDGFRQLLIHEHYNMIGDPIKQGGVTCSKCNKAFQPDFR